MKKLQILTVVLFSLIQFSAYAQTDSLEVKSDTTEVKKKKSFSITFGSDDETYVDNDDDSKDESKKSRNSVRVGMLDLGVSTFAYDGSLNMPDELNYLDQRYGKSLNIGLHAINAHIGLCGKNKPQIFNLATGVRFTWMRYGFEDNFRLLEDKDTFEEAIQYTEETQKRNRLQASYISLPLMLNFTSKPNRSSKSLKLSAGYVHHILLGANHKSKSEEFGKQKVKDNFNLNKSVGMLEVRVGYGPLNLYAQYGLNPMFRADAGPEVTQVNFGINIIPR